MTAQSEAQSERWAREKAELVEDVEWLLSFRIDTEEIAKRLFTNRYALSRRLDRAGRPDLGAKIDRVVMKPDKERGRR